MVDMDNYTGFLATPAGNLMYSYESFIAAVSLCISVT